MTAVAFTDAQEIRARLTARIIGRALRTERVARGETIAEAARTLNVHVTTLARMERGEERNVKLGNALKMLDYVGLTLVVAPKPAPRPPALPSRPLREPRPQSAPTRAEE